jgi:hypothetical protein
VNSCGNATVILEHRFAVPGDHKLFNKARASHRTAAANGRIEMQDFLGMVATFAVLVALSGILPIEHIVSASAQEVRTAAIEDPTRSLKRHVEGTIDIDALTIDSDFSVFMQPDCPPELRLKALRKLWTLLPSSSEPGNSAI